MPVGAEIGFSYSAAEFDTSSEESLDRIPLDVEITILIWQGMKHSKPGHLKDPVVS